MTTLPAITVVVPVYNQEKYVGRCLRSILNQTYSRDDYEIIVVNDGSTDRTIDALRHFLGDVRLIEHSERLGLPAAINTGVHEARGNFIVRLDSDDYVHTEYLHLLNMHLRLNSNFDAVACDYLLVDDHEEVLAHKNCLEDPIGCGIMFRVEQLIEIGLYDEEFLAREDEDLRVRFLERYNIDRIALPLYRYRMHDDNMTNNHDDMRKYARVLEEKHGE